MKKEAIDTNSLAHTKWNCKYHIVFAPKYRRKVFFEEKRLEIREIMRQLCQWKGVEIIEGEVCPDHIHMLVSIPPKMSVRDMHEAMKKTKTVIIPTGVVEQHGYHLPLSTDILNSVMPTVLAGDRLNAVIAPSVNYCFSGGELLGTVNVSPNTFGLYISEIVSEFVRMGFENIIVLLGHAGTDNINALRNSLQMLLRRDKALSQKITLSLVEAWNLSPTWLSGFSLEPEHDFHAGLMETALMMYWAPELVGDEIVQDEEYYAKMMRTDQDWFEKRTKPLDSQFVIETVGQRDEIGVGVMGLPEQATKELGEKICNEIIDNLVSFVDKVEEHRKNK